MTLFRSLTAAAALSMAALLPAAVHAQNVNTIITHPRITNGGVPITGKVEARAVDARGTALSIVSFDGTVNGLKPFTGIVTAGVISGLTTPDQCTSTALTPNTPVYYQIVATPADDVAHPIGYTLPPGTACGATYALDSYRAAPAIVLPPAGLASKAMAVGDPCTSPYIGYLPTAPFTPFECANGHLIVLPGTGGGSGGGPALTLTTTGTGAATYNSGTGVLNVPTPTGGAIQPTVVSCTTSTCTIALPNAHAAFRISATVNTTVSFTAPTGTGFYRYDLFVVGGANTITLPSASSGVQTWTGGVPPSSPAAGQYADAVVKWYGAAPLSGTY